jgi:hypothetical protein
VKKRLIFLALIFLSFAAISFAQRNRIMHDPFHWAKIVSPDSVVEVWFDTSLAERGRMAYGEVEKILKTLPEMVVEERIYRADSGEVWCLKPYYWVRWFFMPSSRFVLDTAGNPVIEERIWRPKRLTIILYPNMQRLNQQRVIEAFLPPGVLAFTEMFGGRIACPVSGNDHEFRATLAHEIWHACAKAYKDEVARAAFLTPSREELPLLLEEGMAEKFSENYLKTLNEEKDLRSAMGEHVILYLVLNDRLPSADEIFFVGGFGIYAIGKNFVSFLTRSFPLDSLSAFRKRVAMGDKLDSAWQRSFGEAFPETYFKWKQEAKLKYLNLSLLTPADSLEIKRFSGTKGLSIVGTPAYDPETNTLVYYRSNDNWFGLEIVLKDLKTEKEVVVWEQFADQSLFYRPWNPSAILRNRLAVVVPHEDRDSLAIYDFSSDSSGITVQKLEETQLPGIFWISDPSFVDEDSLIFVGTDRIGRKNVYAFGLRSRNLKALTDDSFDKSNPRMFGKDLVYLENGGFSDKHFIVLQSSHSSECLSFETDGFPDQILVNRQSLAACFVESNGLTKAVIWNKDSSSGYVYRYGGSGHGYAKSSFVSSPILLQLVGLTDGGELLLVDSENDDPKYVWIKKAKIDTKVLKEVKLTRTERLLPIEKSAGKDSSPMVEGDRRLRFFSLVRGAPAYTNASGEYGLAINQMALAAGGRKLKEFVCYYVFNLSYFDLSERLEKWTTVNWSHYPNFRNLAPFGLVSRDEEISIETNLSLSRTYVWPFDLERRIEFSVGGGYIKRAYDFRANPLTYSTPFLQLGVRHVSDASFFDYMRGIRAGRFSALSFTATTARVRGKNSLLDGAVYFDDRYYLPFWKGAGYLATALTLGRSFGTEPYSLYIPGLYRSSFLMMDPVHEMGTSAIFFRTELRFPIMRLMVTKYKFWKSPYPLFFFSVHSALFLYSGAVSYGNSLPFIHRTGLALKFGLLVFPVYLRWEEYTYLNRLKFVSGLAIEVEY